MKMRFKVTTRTTPSQTPPLETNESTIELDTSSSRMLRFFGQNAGRRALPRFSWGQTFAAFKHRNYRLWFAGQLVSLVGTWMQTTAEGYLMFQLTHSPVYLGYVGFAAGLPSWLFMLYGGVIADRLPRRNLLLLTQSTMMVMPIILAVLTFTHLVQPWHIILLALGLGIANAFDAPARQAFVVEMVGREDLHNAIALNSSMFNLSMVVGPAAAGLTYAWVGPAWCFTLNGLSFVAVIGALLLMRIQPTVVSKRSAAALEDLKEGIRYTLSHVAIRTLVSMATVVSLFGLAFMTLMPAWATDVLGGDATTNGMLLAARGVGALIGALMIAALGRFKSKGKLLTLGSFVFPLFVLLFAQTRHLPWSMVMLVGAGWGFMILFNLANTLLQTLVSDELRGRVISIYTLGFFGLMPLGALLAGWAAALIGEPNTVTLSALVSLAFAGWLWLRVPQLRKLE